MKKNILLIMAIGLIWSMFAETINILPSNDMYTDAEHPGTSPINSQLWTANFPSTGHYERIMIHFDLNNYVGRNIESAFLNLTRLYSCPSGGTTTTNFYLIDREWNENTWPIEEHISYLSDSVKPYIFSGTGGNAIVPFEIDITSYVQNWLENPNANHGIVIIANANQKFSKFYSKEASNANYKPNLTINFEETSYADNTIASPLMSSRNYPNPFNPNTTIEFTLSKKSPVSLAIYNAKGQVIRQLLYATFDKGVHSIKWDGHDYRNNEVSSGIYFYRLTSNTNCINKAILLLK